MVDLNKSNLVVENNVYVQNSTAGFEKIYQNFITKR